MAKNELPAGLLASIRLGTRAGEGGRPLEVRVDHIDPDPDQPRKAMDQIALAELAETIKLVGVLQPILLRRSPQHGRWIIEVGERRWRAAQLAGLTTIPAFEIKAPDPEDRAPRQVIENQHRAALSNTEIARVVDLLTERKVNARRIGVICNIHEQQVKLYRALTRLPDGLVKWADRLDVRTVYELHLAWQKADQEGRGVIQRRLDAVEGHGTLTLTDARRVIKSLQSVPSVRKQGDDAGTEAASETEVAVPRESVLPKGAGGLHLKQEDNDLAGTGSVVDRNGAGEGARLRKLVSVLADALHSAAVAIDPVNKSLADKLRQQAQEARDEVDGIRLGTADSG